MADEETQIQEDQSFWAPDASVEPEPWSSFGEPVAWPEPRDPPLPRLDPATMPAGGDATVGPSEGPDDLDAWRSALDMGPMAHAPAPGSEGAPPPLDLDLDPLPDALWVPERTEAITPMLVTSTLAQTTVEPEPEPEPAPEPEPETGSGPGSRGRWQRILDLRHGNAAIVALVSLVSLLLVGMFLSARARNDVKTGTTPSRTPTGEIAAQRPLNTIPLPTFGTTSTTNGTTSTTSTTSTTGPPPPAGQIDPLLLGGVGAGDPSAGAAGAGAGAGAAPRNTSPVTTAAPARTAAPSGGTEPPPTTEAPPSTSPPDTSPPASDTTPTTRRTPTSISIPDITFPTTTSPTDLRPTTTFPSIPDLDRTTTDRARP